MKRTFRTFSAAALAGVACFGSLLAAPSSAPPARKDPCLAKASKWERQQCESFARSAPADEYFGRMKMSYLGINNTMRNEAISAGDYTTSSDIINKVSFADEALRAWAAKYPNDPELARSYFLTIMMLRKIYTQQYQDEAWRYMQIEVKRFGSTYFGKLEKADIARGFTEHYFADALPCPTPLPSGAVVETTPSATATPQTPSGQPSIDIITPPCVPAPTPVPTPT